MALVRRRTGSVSLLLLLWIVIGIVVAVQRGYLTSSVLRVVLSALLAVVLWPLLLLGVNLHV